MKKTKLEFAKNEQGRYETEIILPGRVNVYARMKTVGSIKALADVGFAKPVEVGTSEYCETPVLDINLIAGTTIKLSAWNEVEEAVMITEEGEV